MTCIAILSRDKASAASKPMIKELNKQLGFTPNRFSIMSLSPYAFKGWADLQGTLAKTLNARTRDGIALAVSQVNSCLYCPFFSDGAETARFGGF